MSSQFNDFRDPLNPYAPPSTAIEFTQNDARPTEFTLFFRWEKFRLLYNVILGVESVWFLVVKPPPQPFLEVVFWLALLAGFANVCFCLGPVLDGYAHWVGLRGRVMSWIFFTLGTLLAMLFAYITLENFQEFTFN